jgi:DNA-binding transcriptional MerR regulator
MELMTTSEVAREVGLTPAAIRTAARQGRLRVAQTTESGVRLFDRKDAKRFAASRTARLQRTKVEA